MKTARTHTGVTFATVGLVALQAIGHGHTNGEWDRFRGPSGSGVVKDGRPLPDALDPAANLRWKRAVPTGNSSPCVSSDRLFVTGSSDDKLVTACLDRATGELLWERAVEGHAVERMHDINSPASPSPTSDGERVYVYFGGFGLIAYDFDGKEAWRRELPAPKNTFGAAASPIMAGEHLVFLHDSQDNSFLEALDPKTGKPRWRRERTGFKSGWSTPAVWQHGDVQELLVYGVWWLTAYDLKNGAERWSVPGLTDEPIITPATGDGLVFVSSYNMNSNPEVIGLPKFEVLLEECDENGDGRIDKEESRKNESILSRFDADGEGDHPLRIFFRFLDADKNGEIDSDEYAKIFRWLGDFKHKNAILAIRPSEDDDETEVAWQEPRGVPECPSLLYYEGRVYSVKNGGMVTCLDALTGEVKFRERLDARGPCYASPVAGDGKIYSASARGVMTVFKAGDELKVISQTELGERVMATPALADGIVYVRGSEHVFAFHRPDGE